MLFGVLLYSLLDITLPENDKNPIFGGRFELKRIKDTVVVRIRRLVTRFLIGLAITIPLHILNSIVFGFLY